MLIAVSVLSAVALLCAAFSLLGVLYPFRPFRTRSRALKSLGGSMAVIAAGIIYTIASGDPDEMAPTVATQAPSVEGQSHQTTEQAGLSAPAIRADTTTTATAETTQPFVDADFYWEASSNPYREQIVLIVNKIARENPNCPDPDPGTVALSQERGGPDDPVFFVTCGSGPDIFNIWFRPSDTDHDFSAEIRRSIDSGSGSNDPFAGGLSIITLSIIAIGALFLAWIIGRVLKRMQAKTFKGIDGFNPTIEQTFITAKSGVTGLAIDEGGRKLAIATGKEKPVIVKFEDVRDAVIHMNDMAIQSTSLGSQALRGAAGAMINPLFAVIGMLTAKKTSRQYVSKLSLKVSVASISKPVHVITFYDGKKVPANDLEKLQWAKDADMWVGRIMYIASLDKPGDAAAV